SRCLDGKTHCRDAAAARSHRRAVHDETGRDVRLAEQAGKRGPELLSLKRFLQGGAAAIGLGQAALAVAGDKNERQIALGQNVGDWIDLLTVKVDVEDGGVEFAVGRKFTRLRNRADGGHDAVAKLVQHVLEQHADQILILDHENAWRRRRNCHWYLPRLQLGDEREVPFLL